jgi:hypothetical protein
LRIFPTGGALSDCEMRGASRRKTMAARGCRGAALSLAVGLAAGGGCSDRPLRGGDAGGPFDPADALASAYNNPCDPSARAGAIWLGLVAPGSMHPAGSGDVGYTAVYASVHDGVQRHDQWITAADAGSCRLLSRPTCAPTCAEPMFCATGNRCLGMPTLKDVGTISIRGLAVPLELTPLQRVYSRSILDPFPPAVPDASIAVETSAGDYAPFSLEARAVEPLAFDGADLSVGHGRSLDVTWTPPTRPGAAHIMAMVALQPSVSGPRIQCTFPDTGAASVPASLLDRLLDLGINGFPSFWLVRRTVTSTNIAPGCVELEVNAIVRRRLSVDGVALCSESSECPPPLTCQTNYTCG